MKSKILCVFLFLACQGEYSFAQWQQTHGAPTFGACAFAANSKSVFVADENGKGVYRSTDNGANWTKSGNGLTCDSVYALAASDKVIFAGSYYYANRIGGVCRSTDNGVNWTQTTTGLSGAYVTAFT